MLFKDVSMGKFDGLNFIWMIAVFKFSDCKVCWVTAEGFTGWSTEDPVPSSVSAREPESYP